MVSSCALRVPEFFMKSSKAIIQTSTLSSNSGLSRRDMLKGVAGLGAAAALSSCTPIFEDCGSATDTYTKTSECNYDENTLWATGWLLLSQMILYRVTGDAEAMTIARKCFRDLNHVFDLCRSIEPGLLGKPHGGRAGPTTSFDQSANPV